jgi:hypothetical protein
MQCANSAMSQNRECVLILVVFEKRFKGGYLKLYGEKGLYNHAPIENLKIQNVH